MCTIPRILSTAAADNSPPPHHKAIAILKMTQIDIVTDYIVGS